jgi:hypothetical protein
MPYLLLLNSEYYHKEKLLRPYIDSCLFNCSHRTLNMTKENLVKYLQSGGKYELLKLNEDVEHDFVQHLIEECVSPFNESRFHELLLHYKRVLKEAASFRNSSFHTAKHNTRVRRTQELSFTRIMTRLRWVLFKGIQKYDGLPFNEIILKLKADSESLLA